MIYISYVKADRITKRIKIEKSQRYHIKRLKNDTKCDMIALSVQKTGKRKEVSG